jgi:Fic-DOC domain mobile mystery protein B
MTDPSQDNASTPLSDEERAGLLLSYITLRSELNEAEQANILEGETWAFARKRNILDERVLNNLHKRMFGNVWRWAAQYRSTQKNIGVGPIQIASSLRQLLGDCRYQMEHHSYSPDEIAARFHHRLVQIHAYPNGNGRHARLATDVLLTSMGQPRFSWGSTNLVTVSETRRFYLEALRAADGHNIGPLLAFVRT